MPNWFYVVCYNCAPSIGTSVYCTLNNNHRRLLVTGRLSVSCMGREEIIQEQVRLRRWWQRYVLCVIVLLALLFPRCKISQNIEGASSGELKARLHRHHKMSQKSNGGLRKRHHRGLQNRKIQPHLAASRSAVTWKSTSGSAVILRGTFYSVFHWQNNEKPRATALPKLFSLPFKTLSHMFNNAWIMFIQHLMVVDGNMLELVHWKNLNI